VRYRNDITTELPPNAAGRLLLNSNHAFSSEPQQTLLLELLLFGHF
jgi:hypothetical protein